jgi:hypothetical protein
MRGGLGRGKPRPYKGDNKRTGTSSFPKLKENGLALSCLPWGRLLPDEGELNRHFHHGRVWGMAPAGGVVDVQSELACFE